MEQVEQGSGAEKESRSGFPALPVFEAWAVCLVFFGVAHLKFEFSWSALVSMTFPRPIGSLHGSTVASRRLTAFAGDHLPSSAPPNGESSLSSGDRLRLRPRGLVFGAATVDDGGITRTPHINVSHNVVVRSGLCPRAGEGERGREPCADTFPRRWMECPTSPGRGMGRGSNYPECSTLLD